MTTGVYNSEIKLENGNALSIRVRYQTAVTEEDARLTRQYFQQKFSEKAGRQVRNEEIKIKPDSGELTEPELLFVVTQGRPFYPGLYATKKAAPYVLPRLVQDLRKFGKEKDLTRAQKELVDYAIRGLDEIAKKDFELIFGEPNIHILENPELERR